ncbi:hypothetical protein [Frondihabitans sp. VKM Ac-2883]|uniref:hypothetical protein n=1 Tax=Frondihabitans sp. VKM Ac-2883 TaxID=2783823 RepID=UPI00188B1A1C|nr:hypothetical protein [Frondihabitans sp. VKM Ac-2883]MBF4577237.1 hypothetical protein [Frondihabitans sp. VKM Ac-2883]
MGRTTTIRTRMRGRLLGAAAVACALALAGTALATPAHAAAGAPVAEGSDWTVTKTAGGYEVKLDVDSPVPLRGAAPVLKVDGQTVGIAAESLDRRQLTVTTTDPAAASAQSVDLGWSSDSDASSTGAAAADATPLVTPDNKPTPLSTDPAATGQYTVARADYNLGDEAVTLRGFGGRKGEMRAAVFVPTDGPGKRPVVVFLHGRHEACVGGLPSEQAWPCTRHQTEIPSYLGYNSAANALASNGYVVVSISANAINALDGSLADDGGAVARGQLVLDHLDLLKRADAGTAPGLSPLLAGKLDLNDVGLMGHSRGGDGVVRAALLNQQRATPFGIKAVLPLAPTDFGRMTLPATNMAVVLPYCDGDVSDLQGQHFYDDSRTAFGDDVLRSSVLVMGADHNFFNSIWTPSKYKLASSDDWYDDEDAVCGAKSATTTRLSADRQSAVGTTLISGFFRLTLGGDQRFLPMFDGSNRQPASISDADLRVSASLPGATRRDLALFTTKDPSVTTSGDITAVTCASAMGYGAAPALPACVDGYVTTVPDFTEAYLAPSVPSTPSLHVVSKAKKTGGEVHVPVAAAARDFSGFSTLSLRLTPDDKATKAADVSISLHDAAGKVSTRRLSDFSDAGQVLPGSSGAPRKTLLQQARIPLSAFAIAGTGAGAGAVDLTAVTEVTIDVPAKNGGILLSDLSLLPTPTLGTPGGATRVAASLANRTIDEGNGRASAKAAIVLSKPAVSTGAVYFDLDYAYDDRVGAVMQKVTFQPGQTCKAVSIPLLGDKKASNQPLTGYGMTLSNTQGGVIIGDSIGQLTVREDDGVITDKGRPVASAPAVGKAGDPCAEAQAPATTISASPATVTPGKAVALSAAGFRVGERVKATIDGRVVLQTITAGSKGTIRFPVTKTASLKAGKHLLTATGYGSAHRAAGSFTVAAKK